MLGDFVNVNYNNACGEANSKSYNNLDGPAFEQVSKNKIHMLTSVVKKYLQQIQKIIKKMKTDEN